MRTMTPEHYRALADAFEYDREDRQAVLAALHTAADQLEAVQRIHVKDERPFEPLADITCQECGQLWPCDTYIAFAADTTPQEDRDA